MYRIYAYIWVVSEVNVGKYSIHGVFETMYAYIGVVLGVNVGI